MIYRRILEEVDHCCRDKVWNVGRHQHAWRKRSQGERLDAAETSVAVDDSAPRLLSLFVVTNKAP